MSQHHTITIPLTRWIEEKLGHLESVPIHKDDAAIVDLVKPDHVTIQWNDLESSKKLSTPLLWNKKYYNKQIEVLEYKRKQSALRVSLSNKYTENINAVTQYFIGKYGLSYETSNEMAKDLILKHIGQPEFFRDTLGIDIKDATDEEKNATGEYYRKL
jgi:hypothetical protein